MRRFLPHLALFVAIQAVILAAFWKTCPADDNHYMRATLDKHARLRSAEGQRVIFVGGSSVAFGIDSRPFAAAGFAPVNMGLSRSLGLPFMLDEVDEHLRPNDVVIIAPEPSLYWSGSKNNALWRIVSERPASIECVPPEGLKELSDQGLLYLARLIRCSVHHLSFQTELETVMRRDSFDAYGDMVGHRSLKRRLGPTLTVNAPEGPAALEVSFAYLERFARHCRERGAHCFIAWCALRPDDWTRVGDPLEAIQARLSTELGLESLEDPHDMVLPPEAFYDPGLHLTGDAAAERSERLLQSLLEHLPQSARPAGG